uniref:Uncharacterized protein n=1 Tax=Glossina austeni TaxID=7395 RepID=A0A1A9V3S9_GLOAU
MKQHFNTIYGHGSHHTTQHPYYAKSSSKGKAGLTKFGFLWPSKEGDGIPSHLYQCTANKSRYKTTGRISMPPELIRLIEIIYSMFAANFPNINKKEEDEKLILMMSQFTTPINFLLILLTTLPVNN